MWSVNGFASGMTMIRRLEDKDFLRFQFPNVTRVNWISIRIFWRTHALHTHYIEHTYGTNIGCLETALLKIVEAATGS